MKSRIINSGQAIIFTVVMVISTFAAAPGSLDASFGMATASPAAGSYAIHNLEQEILVNDSLIEET